MIAIKRISAATIKSFICALFVTGFTSAYADNNNAKDVADQLNALYARTTPCDNGKAAYYCSGIIIHGSERGQQPVWYLSEEREVGSFSYLRADISPHVGIPVFARSGIILTPPDEIEQQKQFNYQVYCAYASDAMTEGGSNSSCGFTDSTTMISARSSSNHSCSSKNIKTVADYLQAYTGTVKLSKQQHDYFLQLYGEEKFNKIANSQEFTGVCAFAADKESFDTAMSIYKYAYRDHPDTLGCNWTRNMDDNMKYCYNNNELIIGAWKKSQVDINQIPIKAFYVIINDGLDETEGSVDATIKYFMDISEQYSKQSHYQRRIPVVFLDMNKLKEGESDIFSSAFK